MKDGSSAPHGPRSGAFLKVAKCSGNRANSIYNRIFARSRTPKCAKLVLGASAVHVRSRLCSRFFGVGPPKKREKGDFVCKRCVLRTREFVKFVRYRKRERASHSTRSLARQAIISLPGGMRVHTRGLERPQLARHGLLSPVPTASLTRRRSLALHRRRPCRRHHRRRCRARACASCRPPWPTG